VNAANTRYAHTAGTSRRSARAIAVIVLLLTAFPFTAPCSVCDLASVIGHDTAATPPPTSRMALRMVPASAGVGSETSTLPGEEAADRDVLPAGSAESATASSPVDTHAAAGTRTARGPVILPSTAAPLRL